MLSYNSALGHLMTSSTFPSCLNKKNDRGNSLNNLISQNFFKLSYFKRNNFLHPWEEYEGLKFENFVNRIQGPLKIRVENTSSFDSISFVLSCKGALKSFKVHDSLAQNLDRKIVNLLPMHFLDCFLLDIEDYESSNKFQIKLKIQTLLYDFVFRAEVQIHERKLIEKSIYFMPTKRQTASLPSRLTPILKKNKIFTPFKRKIASLP